MDFSEVDLSEADLFNTDLSETDLSDANLSGAYLWRADLSDADLSDADLSEAYLGEADLSGAYLWRADLSDADLLEADLSEAHLGGADLPEAGFQRANLSKADLSEADLSEADLSDANLSGADLSEACLGDADLSDADLSEAYLGDANLSGASLWRADLSEANINGKIIGAVLFNATAENTDFRYTKFGDSDTNHTPTNLEHAVLRNADLRGADFTDAKLDQTDLTGARIDAETTFDAETIYERDDEENGYRVWIGDYAAPPAVWVQRQIEQLHEENALSSVATQFHIRKQRARRRHQWNRKRPIGWAWLWVLGFMMGYGEQPRRVVGMAGGVVGIWTLLYPLGNWVVPNPGTPEAAQRGLDSASTASAATDAAVRYPALPTDLAAVPSYLGSLTGTLADSLYFSTVTFTTLGFGDFSPVGFGRVLATVESALGVTLFAVLVFVLGRRATR